MRDGEVVGVALSVNEDGTPHLDLLLPRPLAASSPPLSRRRLAGFQFDESAADENLNGASGEEAPIMDRSGGPSFCSGCLVTTSTAEGNAFQKEQLLFTCKTKDEHRSISSSVYGHPG